MTGQPGPDPFDRALSAIHTHVDNLGPWLAVWAARREPDAHARRCANDAMDAIDATLAALHGLRARLTTETRQADDAAAARVDALLARTRDGPRPPIATGGHPPTSSPPPPQQQGSITDESVSRGGVIGGDP